MRTFLKLRISKGFISGTLNAAVIAGFVGLMQLPEPSALTQGDMGAFIKKHALSATRVPKNLPVGGLGAFIKKLPKDSTPVLVMKKKDATEQISDGNFGTLSVKWKQGVMQVVRQKRCAKHAKAFMPGALVPPLLQKAHAIVESNCNASVVGDAGELGIYQVMPETCRELGVVGDLSDSMVSARCTEKYRQKACAAVKGKCSMTFMFIAHNRGIEGAKRVSDLYALEYARKLDCAARALRGKKCA